MEKNMEATTMGFLANQRLVFLSNCFGSTVGARIRTNAMLMYPAALNADCIQGM